LISEETSATDGIRGQVTNFRAMHSFGRRTLALVSILLIAGSVRLFHLDQSSLWYDEVVTMRLARSESPTRLLGLLGQIDATRAPLHPLLLQRWIAIFGFSDYSGRSFSVLCGVITVWLVYWIGLQAFDVTTALWASWLCAVSPALVYYSREARMYMWLVLVACLAWGLLFSHARSPRPWRLALYGLAVIAIVYSHPLGMLMACALGLASLFFRRAFQISWRGWLSIHLVIVLAVVPWVGQYLDHAPESTTGPLPLRYLFGMPIGFIGGNFWVLFICALLIMYGQFEVQSQKHWSSPIVLAHPAVSISLWIWLLVPTLLLFVYSRVAQPIFGPQRYTLFVGPAYLLLVGRGLGKLPWLLGITTAAAGAILSGVMLMSGVYRPDLKADWKDLAVYLDQHDPHAMVAVVSADRTGNTELETARYYLEPGQVVIPWSERVVDLARGQKSVWVSISLDDGRPLGEVPPALGTTNHIREVVDFSRLRLMKVDFQLASPPGE
jgi:mannosyltransferase